MGQSVAWNAVKNATAADSLAGTRRQTAAPGDDKPLAAASLTALHQRRRNSGDFWLIEFFYGVNMGSSDFDIAVNS
jgi:hypothetical protein